MSSKISVMSDRISEKTPKGEIMKIIAYRLQDEEGSELTNEVIGDILHYIETTFWSNEELWEYINMPVEKIRESGFLKGKVIGS